MKGRPPTIVGGHPASESDTSPTPKGAIVESIWKPCVLSDSDLEDWDRFVVQHPLRHLAQLSCWKNLLENSFSHIKARLLALRDVTSGDIVAGLPLYFVRSPLLGNRLVSVPFATLSEPLVSSAVQIRLLLDYAVSIGARNGAKRVEIRSSEPASVLSQLEEVGVSYLYKHHFIALDCQLDEIWKKLGRTSIRQMITRAEKKGLTVREVQPESGLDEFYRLYVLTRRELSLPPIPRRFFQNLVVHLGPNKLCLLLAYATGRAVGGLLSFRWDRCFAMEYSGDLEEFRRQGVIQLLYWTAIKVAREENRTVFSFGRTNKNNVGLMNFKAHWGTKMEDLPIYYFPPSAVPEANGHERSWQYRLITRVVKYLPPSLCRIAGNFCYSHFG